MNKFQAKILGALAILGVCASVVLSFLLVKTQTELRRVDQERIRQQTMQENNWKSLQRNDLWTNKAVEQSKLVPSLQASISRWACSDPLGKDAQGILNYLMLRMYSGDEDTKCDNKPLDLGWGFTVADRVLSPNRQRELVTFSQRTTFYTEQHPRPLQGFFVLEHGYLMTNSLLFVQPREIEANDWIENIVWKNDSTISYEQWVDSMVMDAPAMTKKTFIIK